MRFPPIANVIIAFAATLLAGQTAAAQSRLEPGSRVRTTIGGSQREFTLAELRADSIVLLDAAQQPLRLAVADLDSLHVSAGQSSGLRRFAKGAAKGILILGSAGLVVGFADGDDEGFLSFSAEEKAMMGFVVFGAIGGAIGGIIGLSGKGHRWVAVPIR